MPDSINRKRLFTGCVVSLVATAFGFAVRAAILENWRSEFNLTQEQIGYLQGVGLFPFAISIILFSLIIDRIGNGVSMAIAVGTIGFSWRWQMGLVLLPMIAYGVILFGQKFPVQERVAAKVSYFDM